jgi:hypothetical protein
MPRIDARLLPRIALLIVLALFGALGMRQLSTPGVVPATAPATEFSAARAMEHLRVIAADSRAVGSPGHASAQQYLIAELRSLGLDPEVQTTSVAMPGEGGDGGVLAGTVSNIIARVPGTDSTGAIAIDAHYDSGPTGPGASDAGSGVVTVLETLRATLAGSPLRNDLIVVFADAEEEQMLGAAAFNDQHVWAQDVRMAVNFEAAGASGPAFLYATGDDNRWVVSEFLSVAPDPRAWSLIPTISNLVPSARLGCDLDEYTDRGSAGLGFVYGGDTPAYHTVRDNADVTDPGSIQQEGGYTLAIVRHFGNLDLTHPPSSGNSVFFNILPGVVVHYPTIMVIPLAAVVTLLVSALIMIGLRREELTARGLLAGTLAFLLMTIGSVAVAMLIWATIRTLNHDYQVTLIGSYQARLYVIALTLATLAMVMSSAILLTRRMRRHNLTAGVLLGATLTLWPVSLAAPGASYLIVWPLLFGLLPLGWSFLARATLRDGWWQTLVLAIAALPVLLLLPATLYQMNALINRFEGLTGFPLVGMLMLFVAPLIALLLPQIDFLSAIVGPTRRWIVPSAAALMAIALVLWGNATSGFDANHPRPDQIAYALNADSGEARWVSLDRHLDAWTSRFFPNGAERGDYDSRLLGTVPAFITTAPSTPLDAPQVAVLSDTSDAGVRTLRLRLSSPELARIIVADIDAPGEVVALAVDGHAVDLKTLDRSRDGTFPVEYRNAPATGWELTLSVRSTEPVTIVVETTKDGLPAAITAEMSPRPAEMMPAPGYARDPTIVSKTFRFD